MVPTPTLASLLKVDSRHSHSHHASQFVNVQRGGRAKPALVWLQLPSLWYWRIEIDRNNTDNERMTSCSLHVPEPGLRTAEEGKGSIKHRLPDLVASNYVAELLQTIF